MIGGVKRIDPGRRTVLAAGLAGGCGALLAGSRAPAFGEISPARLLAADPQAVIHPSTPQPWVGLTFDDGPDPVFTPRVLEVLERFGHRATFFVVASNVAAWPHLVEKALDLGHEVANHSGGHEHLDRLPDAAVWASLDLGLEAVRRVGSSSSLLRPPWGRTTEAVTSWARRHDASQVFWTRTLDGAIPIVGDRAGATVAGLLNPGEIVLTHDGSRVLSSPMRQRDRSRSVAQLQPLLETLEARGLRSVTVSQLAELGT